MDDEGSGGASPAADAESRFVALLKFDLVDSTGISNALSASDELELQRAYQAAVESLVAPDRVRIEWEGDGGLIVFGYPEVRVDAAEIAVRTGLKLIQAVRAVDAVPGVRLEVRVGIASGRVTVDRTRGSLSRVKPVSRAARLMEHAEPGQLLVAEDTRPLVKRFFDYEDLGVVELQGAGRRRVWRVAGETSVVSRFAAQRLNETAAEIVGREDVLASLSDAWSAALEGHGSAVCLTGDSGIGKSRLARAALEWAGRDAAVVLEIDCTPSTGNSPLLPIGVLLRRTAGVGAGASEAEKERAALALATRLLGEAAAREAVLYLAPLFGIESAPIPLDKSREQVRAATIATIVAIVRAQAAHRPLAVLCEDLHWADDTTAQAVRALAGIVDQIPVLLVATRWPKPVTPIDLDAITAAFTTIPVEPLPAPNAAHLVRAVAGDALGSDQVDDIVGRCGGVPLLLEEVARSTMEQADAGAACRASPPSDSAVPPELQLVVESRLEQWPELRGIIEAASVLGREFPLAVLEALVPERRDALAGALSRFAEHGLFAAPGSSGADRAGFRHALIRDAVYETLVTKEYLRRLHSRAADTLMSMLQGSPDASPDVLAQHLRIAGRLDEAISIRLAAGEDTFKRGAYVEAMGHCDAAGRLLDEAGDKAHLKPDAFRLSVLLGMVRTGVHGYSAPLAEVAYREAHGMFDNETSAESRYPVIRGLATAALLRGSLAACDRYALEGLELAERSGRPDYRIDAMSVLCYTTLYCGRLHDCRFWIDRCLDVYEAERGDLLRYPVPQDAKTAALALLPTCAWLLGDAAGAEHAIERGLEHVEALGRDFDTALLHSWTAGTRYTQRRYREALEHAIITYSLGTTHRFEEWEGYGAAMASMSRAALQPSPDAVEQLMTLVQAFDARGIGLNVPYYLWGAARGHVTAGNREAAAAALRTALEVAAKTGETRMNSEIWILQAEIEPDRSKAFELLLDAARLASAQGMVPNGLRATANIVTKSGDASEVEWARATLEILDGLRPAPDRPRWMHDALARADRLVKAPPPAAPRVG